MPRKTKKRLRIGSNSVTEPTVQKDDNVISTPTASQEKEATKLQDGEENEQVQNQIMTPASEPVIGRIEESVLKKKKSLERMDAERREKRANDKKFKKATPPRIHFLRAEQYVKAFRQKEAQDVRLKRVAKLGKRFMADTNPDTKLGIVVRIRGVHGMTSKIKKILSLLRLRHTHTASFVQLNPGTLFMLKLAEHFVTYGYPTIKTVRDLITKRGYTRIEGRRVALTDNTLIENALGKWNVVCLEDIVHEIFTCGPAFQSVNRFIAPFKLNSPHGGFPNKRVPFTEGGDAGSRAEKINQLLQKMI